MSRKPLLAVAALALAISVTVGWSTDSRPVGAPWISLEIPANPMDETTRDAVLLVHAYLHENPAGFRVVGQAEGLVNGERRSIPLEFSRTSRPGVHALRQQWPAEGQWILNIGIEEGGPTSLVVELGPDGGVETGDYYDWKASTLALRSVRVVPGRLTPDRVDAALNELARSTD